MKNSLLMVVDLINEIVHPDGKSSQYFADQCEKNHVIENSNKAINIARKLNLPIIHVKVGFSQDYLDCPKWSPIFSAAIEYGAFQLGTWGTEFHESVEVKAEDYILIKTRVSPFYNTNLESVLRAQQIDTIIVLGVSTPNAILSTVKEGHDRDYKMIVLSDACSADNEGSHMAAIGIMGHLGSIISVNDLENNMKGPSRVE